MPAERENFSTIPESDVRMLADVGISVRGFDIGENQFRAYYDSDNNLIFVIDGTINDRKPNVLLVIDSDDDRKWDDILTTDWDIDLETIRPKKDNKYQKLDIEYSGTSYYSALIDADATNGNVAGATAALNHWRDGVVRRLTAERLDAANTAIENSNETIDKTNETIANLQTRLENLRGRLAQDRRSVGREPTKQSASKILRTESQMDATKDKIARAKKRLANAGRRLMNAEEDAESARKLLALLGDDDTETVSRDVPDNSVVVINKPTLPTTMPVFKDITDEEPKAEEMAEEEVKPLFDKDPEILDDELAFKPIDFGATTDVAPTAPQADAPTSPVTPAPLSFTPPPAPATNDFGPIADVPQVQPVLDSMRPVSEPMVTEPVAPVAPTAPYTTNNIAAADAAAYTTADSAIMATQQPVQENINNTNDTVAFTPRPSPMPEISNASNASGFRPVSPLRAQPVQPVESRGQSKSKLLYYVLLILLIFLSIFALWQYQKSVVDNSPDLATTSSKNASDDNDNQPSIANNSAFLGITKKEEKKAPEQQPQDTTIEEVPVVTEPVSVATPTEPELEVDIFANPVSSPQDTVIDNGTVGATDADAVVVTPLPATEPEPEPTEPDEVVVNSPFLTPAEPEEPAVKTPVVVDKPAYNVSQNEKMFVADPEYETETVTTQTIETTTDDAPVCEDGTLPDGNGCCVGETFVDMEDGTFACCRLDDDGECYPPLL